jgi:hypothetical protein
MPAYLPSCVWAKVSLASKAAPRDMAKAPNDIPSFLFIGKPPELSNHQAGISAREIKYR